MKRRQKGDSRKKSHSDVKEDKKMIKNMVKKSSLTHK